MVEPTVLPVIRVERYEEPDAWEYELATRVRHLSVGNDYEGWELRLSKTKPNVPDGSIRNLRPLYARPR